MSSATATAPLRLRPRPAHETKHIPVLHYPFFSHSFHLAQLDNGATNGTALWLGAQCLSLYLADHLKPKPSPSPSTALLSGGNPSPVRSPAPRAIELGSGIGLSALALASMGWDVIATDLPDVVSSVLARNISHNLPQLPPHSGNVQVRVFDWSVSPDHWTWDDPRAIASPQPEKLDPVAQQASLLAPPFDLVITSDTIYLAELVMPLLRALHGICRASLAASPTARAPPAYICLERRDPALVDTAISQAKDIWNFKVERVPYKKLAKAMGKAGFQWDKSDWEGVEIWKLTLRS
ncbi:hypothetical protein ACG7TL_002928 [Trametes sanguinea]